LSDVKNWNKENKFADITLLNFKKLIVNWWRNLKFLLGVRH